MIKKEFDGGGRDLPTAAKDVLGPIKLISLSHWVGSTRVTAPRRRKEVQMMTHKGVSR